MFAMIGYEFIARTAEKEKRTLRVCEWIKTLQLVAAVSKLSSELVWSVTKTV
jgi:hypothetical protein